jgi:hypothetical protein
VGEFDEQRSGSRQQDEGDEGTEKKTAWGFHAGLVAAFAFERLGDFPA